MPPTEAVTSDILLERRKVPSIFVKELRHINLEYILSDNLSIVMGEQKLKLVNAHASFPYIRTTNIICKSKNNKLKVTIGDSVVKLVELKGFKHVDNVYELIIHMELNTKGNVSRLDISDKLSDKSLKVDLEIVYTTLVSEVNKVTTEFYYYLRLKEYFNYKPLHDGVSAIVYFTALVVEIIGTYGDFLKPYVGVIVKSLGDMEAHLNRITKSQQLATKQDLEDIYKIMQEIANQLEHFLVNYTATLSTIQARKTVLN